MSGKPYEFASVFAGEFLAYLKLRQSQGHQYLREQYQFGSLDRYLLAKNVANKKLAAPVIEGWLQSISTKMNVNTLIVYISHYSGFAKYLHTLGFEAFIPERPIDDKSYAPYIFTESEMKRIFAAADSLDRIYRRSAFANLQFPIILRLLYGCGLRLDEALGLHAGAVDLVSDALLIRKTKGDKDRLVPMDASLADIIRQYISSHCKSSDGDKLLFSNNKGEQHSGTIMRFWFDRTLKAAGIKKPDLPRYRRNICPHCLRHTYAVHSLRKQDLAGTDMYSAPPLLSIYMGHDDILGTEVYLHMTSENSADIIEKTTAYSAGLFPEAPQ